MFVFFLVPLKLNANPFQGVQLTDEEETEADSKDDTKQSSQFCCDREQKQGWAQELSEQESQRIVNKVLYSQKSADPIPPSGPTKGQR